MSAQSKRKNKIGPFQKTLMYFALCISVVFAILPILWGITTSLKLPNDIHSFPPSFIPPKITFMHYLLAVFDNRFIHYLANSFFVGKMQTNFLSHIFHIGIKKPKLNIMTNFILKRCCIPIKIYI